MLKQPQSNFDIIVFNMSTYFDWDHDIVNRNYFILQQLEKYPGVNKIISVDFLPLNFKKGIKHYFQNIIKEPKNAEMIYGDLTSVCYQKNNKVFVYSTIDSIFSPKKVVKELRRIEKILNLNNIIFWSFNPLFVDFVGQLNEKLFVFDTVDNWSKHPSYTKLKRPELILKNYKKIADEADVIFTVSNELLEFYQNIGRKDNVTWIPNGIDFDHFNNQSIINQDNPLSEFDKPIIGYLGTIQERIDIDLLAQIASDHPDKILAICGPIWPSIKLEFKDKLEKFDNVKTFGRIPYSLSPSYIKDFDVCIIPHKVDEFIKTTNPMKLYEYLSMGKPVVTTSGAGVNMFKDYIYIADEPQDFSNKINQAIAEDSFELSEKRQQIVKDHSWENRVDKMIDIVNQKLNNKQ